QASASSDAGGNSRDGSAQSEGSSRTRGRGTRPSISGRRRRPGRAVTLVTRAATFVQKKEAAMKRISAAACVLSIALSGVAYAHGDAPHVQGVVVSATASSLVLKTKAGTQTLIVDSSTKVMRGKKK